MAASCSADSERSGVKSGRPTILRLSFARKSSAVGRRLQPEIGRGSRGELTVANVRCAGRHRYTGGVNERQFKQHLAALVERQRRKAEQAAAPKKPPAVAQPRKPKKKRTA